VRGDGGERLRPVRKQTPTIEQVNEKIGFIVLSF